LRATPAAASDFASSLPRLGIGSGFPFAESIRWTVRRQDEHKTTHFLGRCGTLAALATFPSMIRKTPPETAPRSCLACGKAWDLAQLGPSPDHCPSCGVDFARLDQIVSHLVEVARRFPTIEIGEIRADSPWPPGGDSLSAVELMLALEKDFGVTISARDAEHLDTLGAALRYFAERMPQGATAGPQ
jgi:acyl carrier protein